LNRLFFRCGLAFTFDPPGQDDFGNLHPVKIGISQTPATVIAYLIFIQVADFALAAIIASFSRFQKALTDQCIVAPPPVKWFGYRLGQKGNSQVNGEL
jgi:hypothetical protein